MFSMKTVYGLKALQYLASKSNNEHVLIAEIAEHENIPKKFLETILLTLKNEGILNSKIGKGGGYQLSSPAASISIASIVRALEGSLNLVPCAQDGASKCDICEDSATCGVQIIMSNLTAQFEEMLGSASLADMMEEVSRAVMNSKKVINYSI